MTVVLTVCVGFLAVAALLLVVRITHGPTMLDRVVALDVLVAVVICGLGLEAAINQHTTTIALPGNAAFATFLVVALVGWHVVWQLYKKAPSVKGF